MHIRRSRWCPLGVLLLTAVVGCGRTPSAKLPDELHGPLVLIGDAANAPLWPVLRAGFLSLAKDFPRVTLETVAPRNASPAEQIRLIQQQAKDAAGMAIVVTDVEALTHTIERLFVQGVPVITVHHDAPASRRTTYVGLDQAEVGTAIADALAEGLIDRQNVMLLHTGTDDPAYAARYHAFRERMWRHHPHVAVLREFDCEGNRFRAEEIIRQQMKRYPRLGGWGVLGDWPLHYLQGKEPLTTPGCILVAYGPYPRFWPLIEYGTCHALIGGDYFEMGYQAASLCRLAALGSPRLPDVHHIAIEKITFAELVEYRKKWQGWLAAGEQAPAEN